MRTIIPALLILLSVSAGCQGMGRPQWFNPGTADYQRARAQKFDPYADNDIGPAVVGSRPPGYDRPSAEPTRARWNQWGAPRFGYQ